MIVSLSPSLARTSTYLKLQDFLLVEGSWVKFTNNWPDTYEWAKGNCFEVIEAQLVKYPDSYILPGGDYKDVDLSNADSGIKLYPADENVLYEIALGLKPGDYFIILYVPKDLYVHALGEKSMYPIITDADKKYLGAKYPEDSPHTSPLIKLYAIKDGPAWYIRQYVDGGVDFDKVSIEYNVNKCKLKLIPAPTEQQLREALEIDWHTEIRGF